ncbi:MAG: hypothetical protein J0L75_18075 [Spirochaetes bacterium]|nr:hypothetical protein [Spirochaetota bacterium]
MRFPRKPVFFAALAALILVAASCNQGASKNTSKAIPVVERKWNDFARFVSGLPQEEGSALSNAASAVWYQKYTENLTQAWTNLQTNRLKQMRDWAATELAEANREPRDVLYTFSGPDFLHVFTFLPRAKRYVLIALEPVGSAPDLAAAKPGEVSNYLELVDKSLNDIYKRSYFITFNMDKDLRRKEVDGAVPLLAVFLARTGNRIIDLRYMRLNERGELGVDTNAGVKGKSRQAVQIDFVNEKDPSELRTVVYFSTDLGDKAFKANKPLQKYLDGMAGSVSYVKSASYLMHYKDFSAIRELILAKCYAYIGDDTGIPYGYFDKKKWSIQLYGKYLKPVNDFSGVDQDDLRRAYEAAPVKELPFNLGYHWHSKKQNMMVTIRKGDVAPAPAASNAAPKK